INMDGDPSFDLKGACAAVADGAKLTAAPERERNWFRAVATWCVDSKPDYKPETYTAALKNLVAANPDDPDALTIYAESFMIPARWHWYDNAGVPAPGVQDAERALE